MELENYRPRIADAILKDLLASFGAVSVEGPMWCGKTWTSTKQAASVCSISDSDDNFAVRRRVALDLAYAFDGVEPRLIDECQTFPEICDATLSRVDKVRRHGRFILTGSAMPPKKGVHHSGAGRIATLRMRPMSLWESGRSEGLVSLESVCQDKGIKVIDCRRPSLKEIIELVVRGGWPATIDDSPAMAARAPAAYVKKLIDRDLPELDGIRRDRRKVELVLRSLARNESTLASIATIGEDASGSGETPIDEATVSAYLNAFSRLYVTENIPPFATSLRSGTRVKMSEKRRFCDPSIAASLLRATPARLERDLNTLGLLFESLVLRDLLCYADAFGATISHYRDYDGREADAIVEMPDGEWSAIEIKLGSRQEDAAAKSLLDLKKRIAAKGGQPPRALVVVIGLAGAAYRRRDGVYVIPVTALRP